MNFKFLNLSDNIQLGMNEFAKFHNFQISENGFCVKVIIVKEKKITIEKTRFEINVYLPEESLIFRVMTILLNKKDEDNFTYSEPLKFDVRGVMTDGTQANSLLNLDTAKQLLNLIAGMGYNMFMLYTEDCYVIEGEPYFGYMRPKYTQEDFKMLDNYAFNLGIEMIPCIQTLGHLTEALKRRYPYGDICDDESTLLVGEEKTYALIEKMIKTVSSSFKTKKIHIGLDEAWNLGRGAYLRKNGLKDKSTIMREHLDRIYEITEKYSLQPMMWGDMFFRAKSAKNLYYDLDVKFGEEDRLSVYPNLTPIYWDYYSEDEEFYKKMIYKYAEISDTLIFAGCSRNVQTFASHHSSSIRTTNPALNACKKTNIRQAFTTIWGDDNRESIIFSVLPALMHFAEHFFCDASPDEERCAIRFKECTKESYEDFVAISKIDEVKGYNDPNIGSLSPSRVIIWQDILLGICDKDLGDFDFSPHYKQLKEYFSKAKNESYGYGDLFDFYEKLADVLEIKSQIGRDLYKAYNSGEREKLKEISEKVLPELRERLKKLHFVHRSLFMKHHKAVGWEVLDIRYGGVITRCETAAIRISDYLNGRIAKLEELEEERLSYKNENMIPGNAVYTRICSASRI